MPAMHTINAGMAGMGRVRMRLVVDGGLLRKELVRWGSPGLAPPPTPPVEVALNTLMQRVDTVADALSNLDDYVLSLASQSDGE